MSIKTAFKAFLKEVKLTGQTDPFDNAVLNTEAGAIDNSIEQGKKNKYLPYDLKAVYRTRKDIGDWNIALSMAQSVYPVNYPLQLLYDEIMLDALLTSQWENRKNQAFSSAFTLKKPDGTVDEEQTNALKTNSLYRFFLNAVYDKKRIGNRVVELSMTVDAEGNSYLTGDVIPATNIVQQTGLFYPDYFNTSNYIKYRELPEYGTWILEFDGKDLGILNKAVPHVLFKRFAQACWSELCEIYGTPPRVMKTNTQDPTMLARASKMMKDMGNAAYFIIDDNESFEWAKGMSTNGDVYANLMNMCRDELCLLISGAIIGQDTKNGARSKDQAAQEMLWLLVQSDMAMIEDDFNNIILPALKMHGVIKGDVTFAFEPAEDTQQLYTYTLGFLQYFNIDPEWIKTKFGTEITGERPQPIKGAAPAGTANQSAKLFEGDNNFFRKAPRRTSA